MDGKSFFLFVNQTQFYFCFFVLVNHTLKYKTDVLVLVSYQGKPDNRHQFRKQHKNR